jgi:hypothetical protein
MTMPNWSNRLAAEVRMWSDHVAALAVDSLLDAGLIRPNELKRATNIVSEEIFVRLCLRDYPPSKEGDGILSGTADDETRS